MIFLYGLQRSTIMRNLRHFCGINNLLFYCFKHIHGHFFWMGSLLYKFAAFYNRYFYIFIAYTIEYFSLGVGAGPERTEYYVGNVQNHSPRIL